MNEIAGLPYIEAEFDQHGVIQNPGTIHLPSGVTDLLVASHGWSNSAADARQFYHGFFENFVKEGATPRKPGRQFGVLGVLFGALFSVYLGRS